ncbi:restriction endonuclease subunit S [Cronobacter malonaticus]
MAKYKAYPEYKDSGVEWLGEIPEEWDVINIKYLSQVKRGASPRPIDDPKFFDDDGDYAWVRIADVTASDTYLLETTQKMSALGSSLSVKLEPNKLFLSIAGTVGKPCITAIKACIHDGFVYFPYLKIPNKFLFYVFAGEQAYKGLGKMGTQLNLNTDTVGGIKVALPSNNDFIENIISFLDNETAKIDNLIEKQRQLIELLKEKRQAVISHAVTKGLNPDVPMKDSGVEWLGEVPEHWVVSGFKKYLSSIVDYRGKTPNKTDDGILLVTARNIKKGVLDYTLSQEFIAPSDYKEVMGRGLPDIGDVLFTTEAPLGEVANVDRVDIALAQRIIKFKGMTSRLDNYYFKYFIMSSAFQQSLNLYSSGSTAQGIKAERFVYLRKLLPPINEQMEIVAFLDKEITKIDILVEQQFVMLSLLQERRTALISAAVTGKIDVRDWVAPEAQDVEESQEATA